MTVAISYFAGAGWQFFDSNGVPLAGGLIYTYAAGTTTPLATYTTNAGSIANANPIVLDSAGRVSNEVWLTSGTNYKFVLKTSTGTQIGSYDNIPAANDTAYIFAQLAASSGSSLIGYLPGGTSAVATTVQTKLRQTVSLTDFGAIGDGSANDTAAWLAFKTYCATNGLKGTIPPGTYLIDAFTFGASDSGLILEGESFNPSSGTGAGFFGTPIAVLKARSASSAFVTISGMYYSQISNIHFDGNTFSDSVIYWPGTSAVTELTFNNCEFYGCTATTGYIHRYAGSLQVDMTTFTNCRLSYAHNLTGTTKAAALVYNTNTNAFLINYEKCTFSQGVYLLRYGSGSCNLYNCQFFTATTAIIAIDSITQPFTIINPYSEGLTSVPFLYQYGTAGVTSSYPITIINSIINNASNSGINLNCQQPVNIYGGFIGGNINISPLATYGTQVNIIDGVGFNTGYGLTGVAVPYQIIRGVTVNHVTTVDYANQISLYGGLTNSGLMSYSTPVTKANAGATPDFTVYTFFRITNSSPQNITSFLGFSDGKYVIVYFGDGNSTLVNGAQLVLQGSTNVTPTANSIMCFINISTAWYEVSRSIR